MRRRSRNKFGNKKITIDGINFPSLLQGRQYQGLKLLQASGQISKLQHEVPFRLEIEGKLICIYRADFVYEERDNPKVVIHEAKGKETAVFRLKWKLMKALYPNFEYRLVFR